MIKMTLNGVALAMSDGSNYDLKLGSAIILIKPIITTKPPVSSSVATNGSLTLEINVAINEPLVYQWYKNDIIVVDSPASAPHISGAMTDTLIISNAQPADTGKYTCVVNNGAGETVSAEATVTVTGASALPRIALNPTSQTVNPNTAVTFSVNAEGGVGTLGYQWFKVVGSTDPIPVPTATTNKLVISNTTDADEAGYFCRVYNGTIVS